MVYLKQESLMNNTERYKVVCLNCKGFNYALITQYNNDYVIDLNIDHREYPQNINIISARYRADMSFGWECRCGNTSLVSKLEKNDVEKLVVNGGLSAIKKITESLETDDKKKFSMIKA